MASQATPRMAVIKNIMPQRVCLVLYGWRMHTFHEHFMPGPSCFISDEPSVCHEIYFGSSPEQLRSLRALCELSDVWEAMLQGTLAPSSTNDIMISSRQKDSQKQQASIWGNMPLLPIPCQVEWLWRLTQAFWLLGACGGFATLHTFQGAELISWFNAEYSHVTSSSRKWTIQ